MRVPEYVSTADQHDALQHEIAQIVVQSVWHTKKILSQKIAQNEEDHLISDEQIEAFKRLIEEETERAVHVVTENVYNPHNLLSLGGQLQGNQEYDLSVTVGKKCQQVLEVLEKTRQSREAPLKQLQKLREEKGEKNSRYKKLIYVRIT
jgi:anion-transporting  ArsA/GET3 family ATPase